MNYFRFLKKCCQKIYTFIQVLMNTYNTSRKTWHNTSWSTRCGICSNLDIPLELDTG